MFPNIFSPYFFLCIKGYICFPKASTYLFLHILQKGFFLIILFCISLVKESISIKFSSELLIYNIFFIVSIARKVPINPAKGENILDSLQDKSSSSISSNKHS